MHRSASDWRQSSFVGSVSQEVGTSENKDYALTRRMDDLIKLPSSDRERINRFCGVSKHMEAGSNLILAGEHSRTPFVLNEGWGYRYKNLQNGRRQVLGYLVPGDICNVYAFVRRRMDISVALITDATVGIGTDSALWNLLWSSPKIGQAFFRSLIVEEAMLREHLISMGRRNACERIAHFLCEIWHRLDQVGLIVGDTAPMPVTQEQLGDTLGITSVHVNRTLQILRADGVISLKNKHVIIHDMRRLRQIADFDGSYLRIDDEL